MTGDSWLYVLGAVSLGFAFGLYCGISVEREPILTPAQKEAMWLAMQPDLDLIDAERELMRSAGVRVLKVLN